MKRQILFLTFLLFALTGFAQTMKVSGVVTSAEDGYPLPGVAVAVKENPSAGVATDLDGNYTVSVSKGQTLVFSYVGCQSQSIKVGDSATINVSLKSDANVLQEVVAIGYGTMKKSDLTGSVTTVAADKLQKTPAASLANALQGQAAGVTVNSNSGQPGAAPEVRIRGVGTVNGASPIYVVDGIIVDDITFLSPNDIESTEILKDASATAIYGSRGANGVIIVTTKGGGKNQKTRVTLDAYVGVQQRWRKLDVMNARDFADTKIAINGTASEKKLCLRQRQNICTQLMPPAPWLKKSTSKSSNMPNRILTLLSSEKPLIPKSSAPSVRFPVIKSFISSIPLKKQKRKSPGSGKNTIRHGMSALHTVWEKMPQSTAPPMTANPAGRPANPYCVASKAAILPTAWWPS